MSQNPGSHTDGSGADDERKPSTLILASGSEGRLDTLRRAGLDPEVIVSGVDETVDETLPPAEQARVLAERKATAVADVLTGAGLVLGCDSMLELDGVVYGKPMSAETAAERWRQQRGRTGILHTGHCVIDLESGKHATATGSTMVRFADLTDAEIDAYVATGEPLGVAGAFKTDGLGGAFVESIDGDYHNIVGVSLPLLRSLLGELGVALPTLWKSI